MSTTATTSVPSAVPAAEAPALVRPDPANVRRLLARRSVATLSTVSAAGRPHAATVLYQLVDDDLFVSTHGDSRKARNVAETGRAAVAIAVRRLPVGPPAGVQLQAHAEVLGTDDAVVRGLAADGRLRRITSHGELDLPGGCFLRIALPRVVHTYGLGVSLWRVLRDPLAVGGVVELRG